MDMDCTTVASTLIDQTCNQAEISWSDIVCRHVLNSDGFDTRAALLSVNNGLAYLLLLIRFGHPRPWPQAMEGKLRLLGTGAFCCRDATVELRRKKTSPVCSPTVLPLFLFSRGFSTPYPRLRRAASQPTCVRPVSRLPSTNCCTRRRLLLDEFLPPIISSLDVAFKCPSPGEGERGQLSAW
jgi:hypothetical protein